MRARVCVYGVDRNPMAVELSKVALWIETVEPGKPLGFLDANIRCGDSLLGVFDFKVLAEGIPDAAYKPLAGDDKETAKHFEKRNKAEREGQGSLDFAGGSGRLPAAAPMAGEAKALRLMPEDSPDQIAAKRKRFEAALADPHRWNLRVASDLYIAAFLTSKTGGALVNRNAVTIPTTAHIWDALAGRTVYGPLVGRAQELAGASRVFHWPLEFPDIMAIGGFNAVLGNPPWERIKLQEQEFFAARELEVANAPNKAARDRLIAVLREAKPGTRERTIYDEFQSTKHRAEAISVFARVGANDGGRFPLAGRGDVNTYALFAELFASLAQRGRAGLIVPTGIATDATTAPFFAALVSGKRLARLIDFENRDAIFPAIHRSYKFSLLTIGRDVSQPSFSFFLTDVSQLADPERQFTLSAEEIARINPNTKTAPVFRSRADAELTAKMYRRVPVLIDEAKGIPGDPWGAYYLRLVHYGDHSKELFDRERCEREGFVSKGSIWIKDGLQLLPVYESKYVNIYDHRYATAETDGEAMIIGHGTDDGNIEIFPRYWVSDVFFDSLMLKYNYSQRWFLAYRDIARANDVRTMIAVAIPRFPASVNLPILGFDASKTGWLLLANINSLVADYVARQSVSGAHMTFSIIKQLPLLSPHHYTADDVSSIRARILELTYTSHSMAPFAREIGYDGPPFVWNEDRRALLRAELDAWFARAYGLTRDELRYILDPADVKGADYPSETFRVLKANEIKRFGEYRTAKMVLQAWDVMEQDKEGAAVLSAS
jgi:hypothetical protein